MARSRVLVWLGRLLVVAGAAYGMWHTAGCGAAWFPDGGVDADTRAACTSVLAGRTDTAWLLIILGATAMVGGQLLGRSERAAARDAS